MDGEFKNGLFRGHGCDDYRIKVGWNTFQNAVACVADAVLILLQAVKAEYDLDFTHQPSQLPSQNIQVLDQDGAFRESLLRWFAVMPCLEEPQDE